ncbi:hypothetical protein COT72_01125 [archaeon CG10_big_fil_rev_8_21_14_0_10_43_11]|nr:MAG: hypothetical protein COT72_01125 [archaeon CG10_big_fil_rev_8_21_14_0_10_43_11]
MAVTSFIFDENYLPIGAYYLGEDGLHESSQPTNIDESKTIFGLNARNIETLVEEMGGSSVRIFEGQKQGYKGAAKDMKFAISEMKHLIEGAGLERRNMSFYRQPDAMTMFLKVAMPDGNRGYVAFYAPLGETETPLQMFLIENEDVQSSQDIYTLVKSHADTVFEMFSHKD